MPGRVGVVYQLDVPPFTQFYWNGKRMRPLALSRARTYWLTKKLIGRTKVYNPGVVYSVGYLGELETPGQCFDIGIPNISPNPVAGVKVSVAFTDNAANGAAWRNPSTGVWYDLTFGGAATGTLAARLGAERESVTYADRLPWQSIARLDGSKRHWVMIRIEYPAGVDITIPYNNFYDWATPNPGGLGRRHITLAWNNLGTVSNKALATTSPQVYDNICVPIIRYLSKVPAQQVIGNGDSTSEGLATSTQMLSGLLYAAQSISTPDDPIEYYNTALHSQVPLTYVEALADAIATVRPTEVIYQPYSINDSIVGNGFTGNAKARAMAALGRCMDVLNPYRDSTRLLLLEGLPANYAARAVGALDSYRRDFNALELPTYASETVSIATGYADLLSGPIDVNGQTTIADKLTTDGLHPAALGNARISPPIADWLLAG
jgi:hypothetical protein